MIDQLKQKLGEVTENESLASHTTFKIGGPAKYFFEAKTKDDLVKALQTAEELKIDYFLLGGGSNLLVSDQGLDGLTIKQSNTTFKITDDKVYTESGALVVDVLDKTLESSLVGWPWAAGLPGTIGGAIRGNAGAYGKAMSDITESVEIYQKGKVNNFTADKLGFKYRHSVIKETPGMIVVAVNLKLKKGSTEEVKKDKDQVKIYNDRRENTQPLDLPNSGCVFKNIDLTKIKVDKAKVIKGLDITEEEYAEATKFDKLPVSYILDRLGLKGKTIGGAQVSEKHGAFVVNTGEAKAEHVIMLISDIKMRVRNELGIQLMEEVQYLGF
ncbi:MAG: UDP-N-acetylenolpyruvoylglucosamine reductase [Parcubacteria group bacterium]|nr:UDP-N-acetylenolpyruvoylglucosamine reductase [Parcubacteria group bacterium]|tara:strand:+ start:1884 stop:2864 length:981 start_codon:yes stop_codon:yes gene_type:complete